MKREFMTMVDRILIYKISFLWERGFRVRLWISIFFSCWRTLLNKVKYFVKQTHRKITGHSQSVHYIYDRERVKKKYCWFYVCKPSRFKMFIEKCQFLCQNTGSFHRFVIFKKSSMFDSRSKSFLNSLRTVDLCPAVIEK